MTFGEKLQKLRAREGVSQERLAELLDVSRQAVSRWERDETMPETEKVIRLSEYFAVTTDYLLRDGPERWPEQTGSLSGTKHWFRDKGHLLGWVLAAIGTVGTARLLPSLLLMTGQNRELGASLWVLAGQLLSLYAWPWVCAILVGVLTALIWRKQAGTLTTPSIGWPILFWGGVQCVRLALWELLYRFPPKTVSISESAGPLLLYSATGVTAVLALLLGAVLLRRGNRR